MMVVMAALPWALRRWQQRSQTLKGVVGVQSQVLGVMAVGPGQRVVTVQVQRGHEQACLVLGVTAHSIQCLHVLSSTGSAASSTAAALATNTAPVNFAQALHQQQSGAPE